MRPNEIMMLGRRKGIADVSPKLWLRASLGTNTTVDGSAITSWADQSTNAFASFTTGTASPTYKASGINSLPSIQFAAASTQNLVSAGLMTSISTTTTDIFFAVCQVTSISTNSANTFSNVAVICDGNNNYRGIYLKSGGPTACGYVFDSADRHADGTIALATPMLIQSRHVGGNVYVQINNGTETSSVGGSLGVGNKALQIGRGAGGYLNGFISEIVVVNADLSNLNLQIIRQTLRARYALW
jgi:hypothetical protein